MFHKLNHNLSKFLREQDGLSEPSYVHFHFKGDEKSKSIIGGCFSILITMFLLKIGIENGIRMFTRDEPDIISIEEKLDYEQLGE